MSAPTALQLLTALERAKPNQPLKARVVWMQTPWCLTEPPLADCLLTHIISISTTLVLGWCDTTTMSIALLLLYLL